MDSTSLSYSGYNDQKLSNLMQQYQSQMIDEDLNKDIESFIACLPDPMPEKYSPTIRASIKVTSFLTNITHIVLNALSFNVGVEYISMWDLSNVAAVYTTIIMLPIKTVSLLKMDTQKTIIVAFSVYSVGLAGLSLFMKYKPKREELPGSPRNISKEVREGYAPEVIGYDGVINTAIRCVSGKSSRLTRPPLFIGPTGAGKTTLAYAVAKKVPQSVYLLDVPAMVGNGYQTFADKIKQLVKSIEGYEEQYLFFVDEIDVALTNNPSQNLWKFIEPLVNHPNIRCIVTISNDWWKKLQGSDPEFCRRFKDIDVNCSDGQAAGILADFCYTEAPELLVDSDIYDEIIKQTKDIPSQYQPAIGVEVMKEAISLVSEGAIQIEDKAGNKRLCDLIAEKELELSTLRKKFHHNFDSEYSKKLQSLTLEIQALKEKLRKTEEEANKVKDLAKELFKVKEKLIRTAKKIQTNKKQNISEKHQKKYIWLRYHILPELEKKCLKQENSLSELKDMYVPLRINKLLIEKVIAQIKTKYPPVTKPPTTKEEFISFKKVLSIIIRDSSQAMANQIAETVLASLDEESLLKYRELFSHK